MPLLPRISALWRGLRHRADIERDLDAELRAYVDLLVDEKVRTGVPADVARRQALLDVGGVEQVKEEVRDVRPGAFMDVLRQDVRVALRACRRAPGFTVAAVLALALGIGANSALFTLADAMLVRARPGVGDADRLVWLTATEVQSGRDAGLTYPDFVELRALVEPLASIAAVSPQSFAVSFGGGAERMRGELVSASYFAVLRMPLALGRGFVAAEDSTPGAHPVAVIGHDLWQRRFAGDSAVLGRPIVVNGLPLTIVGVAAPGFVGLEQDERSRALWVPIAMLPALYPAWGSPLGDDEAGVGGFTAVGRLRPGVHATEVDAALALFAHRRAAADAPRWDDLTARTFPAGAGVPPGSMRDVVPIASLGVAVTGLLLLLACANVCGLLLGRAVARRREIGIRLALGASRARLVRQLLTESLLLALLAAVSGLVLARVALDVLLRVAVPIPLDAGLDWRVLGVTLGVATVAALLAGLAPALRATRVDLVAAPRDGALDSGPARTRLQSALVVAQVALAVVLLMTAGLFVRSSVQADGVDVGFDASERVLAASFEPSLLGYDADRTDRLLGAFVERARALPGVRAAAAVDMLPLDGRMSASVAATSGDAADARYATRHIVTPGYFRAMRIPLVVGRDFDASDGASAPTVAIVSAALAHRLWPDRPALGEQLRVDGPKGAVATVVGVARDVRGSLVSDGPAATLYLAQPQRASAGIGRHTLVVRADGDARWLVPMLRRHLHAIDPNLPVHQVRTLADVRDASLAGQRHGSAVLGGFGVLALLLAAMGVYAVLAFTVGQRTREIAVRIALGAAPRCVVVRFVRRGLRLVVAGLLIGLALAWGTSRLLASMLRGVQPADLLTVLGVAALLGGTALLAAWLPARRAARVDPMRVLRAE